MSACRTVRRSIFTRLALAAVVAWVAFAMMPGHLWAQAQHVATVEGISEYQLPNGLRILLFPDASRQSTTVNITYLVGSRHESYGESGMAHLLEHLVFKGTPTHPNIPQELTEHGGRANGTTWYDRTNYFITFPASDENLEWALGLEADRMVNSFVRQSDLDSEMTVVRNEFESGENSPGNVLFQRTMATAYLWHGYGRSTIGARSDLEGVPIERLQAFYRKYYQPDNAILVITGAFDTDDALRRVERTFGAIPRPERSGDNRLWATYTREPVQDGEREVTVRRVGDLQFLMMVHHIPAAAHPDFAALSVLSHILGNAPSGRAYKALVEPGLAAQVGATALPVNEPGHMNVAAVVRMEQSLDEAREVLARTLAELASSPPTEEEVERARAELLRGFQLALNNSERIGIDLTEWAASGDWRLMFIHRDRIRDATVQDVARVAEYYLRPSNRTVGLFRPEADPIRTEVPEAPDIRSLVDGYAGSEVVAEGEVFEPTPENIESRTVRIELPNGFELALLPKQTRGQAVQVRWTQRMGNEADLTGRSTAGSMAGGMLMRGTTERTRQEMNDELARIQAQMFVSGSATIASGSIETTRPNLAAALRLLSEAVRQPAMDSAEFAALKRERLAALESQRTEPGPLASIAFARHMAPRPGGHPQYVETIDEAIASTNDVTLEQVRAFHREFYGAGSGGSISVVGDFDSDVVEGLVRELFGDWPRQREYTRVPVEFHDAPDTTITIITPDKANANLVAGFNIEIRDDHPDYPALVMGAQALGGGFLSSRLAERIRQREGLSYGVGAALTIPPLDSAGRLQGFAIYAPENRERVLQAFREEVVRAAAEGFTADELETARSGWLQQREVSRGTDGSLASALQNGLFLDRTLMYDADLEARVRALTVEEVNAAFRRHITPDRLVFVVAGDFRSEPVP